MPDRAKKPSLYGKASNLWKGARDATRGLSSERLDYGERETELRGEEKFIYPGAKPAPKGPAKRSNPLPGPAAVTVWEGLAGATQLVGSGVTVTA